MTRRQLRALRGTVAAVVATLTAGTAHTLSGGGAPSPLLLAVVAVLAAPIAMVMIGRRSRLIGTAIASAASQIVFHLTFVLAGSLGHLSIRAGHEHGAVALAGAPAAMTHAVVPGFPMLAAHLIAGAVSLLTVHRGERMLRALGRAFSRLIPTLSVTMPRVRTAPCTPARARAVALRPVFRFELHRRGPPALAR